MAMHPNEGVSAVCRKICRPSTQSRTPSNLGENRRGFTPRTNPRRLRLDTCGGCHHRIKPRLWRWWGASMDRKRPPLSVKANECAERAAAHGAPVWGPESPGVDLVVRPGTGEEGGCGPPQRALCRRDQEVIAVRAGPRSPPEPIEEGRISAVSGERSASGSRQDHVAQKCYPVNHVAEAVWVGNPAGRIRGRETPAHPGHCGRSNKRYDRQAGFHGQPLKGLSSPPCPRRYWKWAVPVRTGSPVGLELITT